MVQDFSSSRGANSHYHSNGVFSSDLELDHSHVTSDVERQRMRYIILGEWVDGRRGGGGLNTFYYSINIF